MKRYLSALTMVLTLIGSVFSSAQIGKISVTEGRRYVVTFPQVWSSPTESPLPQPMTILIGSRHDTKVTVRSIAATNPNAGINRTYVIQKNQVIRVPVPTTYMNIESENITGFGIEVLGEKPVTVYTYQSWMGNGELARHLPVQSWGKEYYTMNFYLDRYGTSGSGYKYRPSQSVIVSAYDNTVVTFTPTVETEGGSSSPPTPKRGTTMITLNKGETFLIRSKVNEVELKDFSSDMSGTLIRSSKPVGIVSGHTKVAVMRYPDVLPPTGMFAAEAHFVRNNVHDAMLPIEMAGTKFVVVPTMYTPTRVVGQGGAEFGIDDDRGDVVRFIATQDNTIISSIRSDGTSANIRRLNRGETHLVTEMQQATMYVSDKPILVGQYGKSYAKIIPPAIRNNGGKDGDEAQGHPTVESGMPMLQYVPSVDRWVEYGVFSAPEGMDNFVNIVFTTSDINKIKMDGRTLSSSFGGAMRLLPGTPYAYIRASVAAGTHTIESDPGSGVKWIAWTYGSLDGLQQGRAYGTPISSNLARDCEDSLQVKIDTLCGDWSGIIQVTSDEPFCADVFDVWIEDDFNVQLNFDSESGTSDANVTTYPFTLKIVDRSMMAYATVVIVTKSGTMLRQQFEYKPNAMSVSTNLLDYGVIAKNDSVCKTFTIKNEGDKDFYLSQIRAKIHGQYVTITPSSGFVKAGDSSTIEVCIKASFVGAIQDSIVFSYASYVTQGFCYEVSPIIIKARVSEPDFFASDQDWGIIGKNQVVTKTITLVNMGDADAVVTGYSPALSGPYFSNLQVNLPLTLKSGDRITLDVDYTPNGEVGVRHTQRIDWTVNATKTKLYSWLSGEGADASVQITGATWIERVIDQWQTDQGITEYIDTVYLDNVGLRAAQIQSIEIVGADATYFTIKDARAVPPIVTAGVRNLPVVVSFRPTEDLSSRSAEREYNATIAVTFTVDGVPGVTGGDLEGTAIQPRLSARGWDFGVQQVGSTTSHPIEIYNVDSLLTNSLTGNADGTMRMELFELTIPNGYPFVWTRNGQKTITFNPSTGIAPGISNFYSEDVSFQPTVVGTWVVPYEIKYNGHIIAKPYLRGTSTQSTSITVSDVYAISWFNHSIDAKFSVTSSTNGVIEVKEPVGSDANVFSIVGWTTDGGVTINPVYNFIPVTAGNSIEVVVRFTPAAVTWNGLSNGQNLNGRLPLRVTPPSFYARIEVVEIGSQVSDTSNLVGDGKYLESTVFIPTTYTANVGEPIDIYVYSDPTPQSLDSGYVSQFRTRLSYDPTLLYPLSVIQKNTQTENWRIVSYNILNNNMIELDLKSDSKSTLTNSNQLPIYGVRFQTLLSSEKTTQLPVQLYWVDLEQEGIDDRQYMVFNYEPGELTVSSPCAGVMRLVGIGNTQYFIKSNGPVIGETLDVQYGVGISANVEMYLVNIMGEVISLVNGTQTVGTYQFTSDISDIAAGVYYLVYKSADFTSKPIKLVKQ